jgi:hypothetical protein
MNKKLSVDVRENRTRGARKEYSIWIVEGDARVCCVLPMTEDKRLVAVIRAAFDCFLEQGGAEIIRREFPANITETKYGAR